MGKNGEKRRIDKKEKKKETETTAGKRVKIMVVGVSNTPVS